MNTITPNEPLVKSLGILSGFILAQILLTLLSGCTRKVYVPVETVIERTDTVRHTERVVEWDTVSKFERIVETRLDSVAPILDSVGRMIGYDRWHVIDRSASLSETNARLTAQIDSLSALKSRAERIREPYPVEVVKEVNRLRWWHKALIAVGVIALMIRVFSFARSRLRS